jgi:tRNA(fMet)-specific endonuclease VapC
MKDQPPQVADRFAACRVGEVVILAITAAELEFAVVASGAKADRNREALEQFLLEVVLVTNNLADFQAYPDLRRETWVESSSTTAQPQQSQMWVSRSTLTAGLRRSGHPAPRPRVQPRTEAGDHQAYAADLHLFSAGAHQGDAADGFQVGVHHMVADHHPAPAVSWCRAL